MKEKTIAYYDNNASELIVDYNSADMKKVYQVLDKYILPGNRVLDIGFGSGRDILHFSSKKVDMWGVDASKVFVETFKSEHKQYHNRVFRSTLPELQIIGMKEEKFDVVYSIATWMHLAHEEYKEAIKNIKKVLKKNAILILSYSYSPRYNDPRFFESIIPENIVLLFNSFGFKLIESIKSDDALKRNQIKWITQIYKLEG